MNSIELSTMFKIYPSRSYREPPFWVRESRPSDAGDVSRISPLRTSPTTARVALSIKMPPKSNKMDDALLISIVEQHEELYNLHHPQYLNQQRRDSIWEEIGSIMKHDSYICKERWARIRDNFRKALNLRRTKAGKLACKIKAPRFNKELSFLIPFFTDDDNKHSIKSGSETDEEATAQPQSPSPFASAYMPVFSSDCDEQNSNPNVTSRETASSSAYRYHESDPLIDFFLTMGRTVKTFPLREQVRIKGELFKIVNSTEMKMATCTNIDVAGKSDETTFPSTTKPASKNLSAEISTANINVKTEPNETDLAVITEQDNVVVARLQNPMCIMHPYTP
ncbi:uncharacterized protein LOC115440143 [Manduca sexta]|uniref:uncharacterized protein LOC115440143 n=1 Tax=Manduca sexta TaxID=7130 RepID=UPI00189095FA|nr:uncharacterized protein LOC115440143 [Manduca sexta]